MKKFNLIMGLFFGMIFLVPSVFAYIDCQFLDEWGNDFSSTRIIDENDNAFLRILCRSDQTIDVNIHIDDNDGDYDENDCNLITYESMVCSGFCGTCGLKETPEGCWGEMGCTWHPDPYEPLLGWCCESYQIFSCDIGDDYIKIPEILSENYESLCYLDNELAYRARNICLNVEVIGVEDDSDVEYFGIGCDPSDSDAVLISVEIPDLSIYVDGVEQSEYYAYATTGETVKLKINSLASLDEFATFDTVKIKWNCPIDYSNGECDFDLISNYDNIVHLSEISTSFDNYEIHDVLLNSASHMYSNENCIGDDIHYCVMGVEILDEGGNVQHVSLPIEIDALGPLCGDYGDCVQGDNDPCDCFLAGGSHCNNGVCEELPGQICSDIGGNECCESGQECNGNSLSGSTCGNICCQGTCEDSYGSACVNYACVPIRGYSGNDCETDLECDIENGNPTAGFGKPCTTEYGCPGTKGFGECIDWPNDNCGICVPGEVCYKLGQEGICREDASDCVVSDEACPDSECSEVGERECYGDYLCLCEKDQDNNLNWRELQTCSYSCVDNTNNDYCQHGLTTEITECLDSDEGMGISSLSGEVIGSVLKDECVGDVSKGMFSDKILKKDCTIYSTLVGEFINEANEFQCGFQKVCNPFNSDGHKCENICETSPGWNGGYSSDVPYGICDKEHQLWLLENVFYTQELYDQWKQDLSDGNYDNIVREISGKVKEKYDIDHGISQVNIFFESILCAIVPKNDRLAKSVNGVCRHWNGITYGLLRTAGVPPYRLELFSFPTMYSHINELSDHVVLIYKDDAYPNGNGDVKIIDQTCYSVNGDLYVDSQTWKNSGDPCTCNDYVCGFGVSNDKYGNRPWDNKMANDWENLCLPLVFEDNGEFHCPNTDQIFDFKFFAYSNSLEKIEQYNFWSNVDNEYKFPVGYDFNFYFMEPTYIKKGQVTNQNFNIWIGDENGANGNYNERFNLMGKVRNRKWIVEGLVGDYYTINKEDIIPGNEIMCNYGIFFDKGAKYDFRWCLEKYRESMDRIKINIINAPDERHVEYNHPIFNEYGIDFQINITEPNIMETNVGIAMYYYSEFIPEFNGWHYGDYAFGDYDTSIDAYTPFDTSYYIKVYSIDNHLLKNFRDYKIWFFAWGDYEGNTWYVGEDEWTGEPIITQDINVAMNNPIRFIEGGDGIKEGEDKQEILIGMATKDLKKGEFDINNFIKNIIERIKNIISY